MSGYRSQSLCSKGSRKVILRHPAKFQLSADRLNRCGAMAIFRFFKMAATAILDLFYKCLDHPHSVVDGLYRYANVVGIGVVVLKMGLSLCDF